MNARFVELFVGFELLLLAEFTNYPLHELYYSEAEALC